MLRPGMWTPPPPPTGAPVPSSSTATAVAGHRYQADAVTAATPAELTGLLFTGALERIRQAREALLVGDRAAAHPHLMRGQDIVGELRSALSPAGGELSVALDGVYGWVLEHLVKAVVHGDIEALHEAESRLRPIAEAWDAAVVRGARP